MNSTALIIFIVTLSSVTFITIYYFYKAFKTPIPPVDDDRPEINKPDFT
ncbi:MAG: hypothetical protein IPK62_14610 [Bacteroidetes bacterium]|nr:hypothetical protein [Bacteroidota bacterium]MBK8146123.1 hypothetical protein [Bacteroidota bacterium]MBP6313887.1 hypothetical protein [Chitinophagaceae bacterium]